MPSPRKTREIANRAVNPIVVSDISTDTTLTAGDSGRTFRVTGVDKTVTLPAAQAGLNFSFIIETTAAATGSTGTTIAVQTGDTVNDGTASKGIVNSSATDAAGDFVKLLSVNATDWYTVNKIGTWAAES